MKITDRHVFFYDGIYSQWYTSRFKFLNRDFTNCEQFMMASKAVLFNDGLTYSKIMNTTSPKKQKHLGRIVRNFDNIKWDMFKFDIVLVGNYLKFTQNEFLKNDIVLYGDRLFVEASPFDNIWGIGRGVDYESIDSPKTWRGKNLLGQAITKVRDCIINNEELDMSKIEKIWRK